MNLNSEQPRIFSRRLIQPPTAVYLLDYVHRCHIDVCHRDHSRPYSSARISWTTSRWNLKTFSHSTTLKVVILLVTSFSAFLWAGVTFVFHPDHINLFRLFFIVLVLLLVHIKLGTIFTPKAYPVPRLARRQRLRLECRTAWDSLRQECAFRHHPTTAHAHTDAK
jgi:hypothetical protein